MTTYIEADVQKEIGPKFLGEYKVQEINANIMEVLLVNKAGEVFAIAIQDALWMALDELNK